MRLILSDDLAPRWAGNALTKGFGMRGATLAVGGGLGYRGPLDTAPGSGTSTSQGVGDNGAGAHGGDSVREQQHRQTRGTWVTPVARRGVVAAVLSALLLSLALLAGPRAQAAAPAAAAAADQTTRASKQRCRRPPARGAPGAGARAHPRRAAPQSEGHAAQARLPAARRHRRPAHARDRAAARGHGTRRLLGADAVSRWTARCSRRPRASRPSRSRARSRSSSTSAPAPATAARATSRAAAAPGGTITAAGPARDRRARGLRRRPARVRRGRDHDERRRTDRRERGDADLGRHEPLQRRLGRISRPEVEREVEGSRVGRHLCDPGSDRRLRRPGHDAEPPIRGTRPSASAGTAASGSRRRSRPTAPSASAR